MEKENEDAQVDVVEQEEQTSDEVEEVVEETEAEAEEESNDVTLSKEEFTKLKRKAIAYDSTKGTKPTPKAEANNDYLEDVFMVKDLSQDEYETLKGESNDLGIPFKKYLSSQSGKTLLSKVRAEKKSKDSMENISSKSPVYKKFSQQDISKMSAAEMEKILSE